MLRRRLVARLARVPAAAPLARLTVETIRVCLRYRVTGLASEAAFFMLLSLPPLLLGLFAGVGYVGQWVGPVAVSAAVSSVREYAGQLFTAQSVSDVIAPTIDDVFRGGRVELVSLGFLLALWSGSRALNVYLDTISIMYGQSGVRGIVRTRALSFTLYVVSLVFAVVLVPLILIGPALLEQWVHVVPVVYWSVVTVGVVALLAGLFHVSAPERLSWRREVPGAVLALALWVLASFVVRGALSASIGGTSIYGPLTAPIVVLIWLYAVAISILIGAALNSAARTLFPTPGEPSPGGAQVGGRMHERIGHGADLVAEQFLHRDASAPPSQGNTRP